ncbi:MAG: hypothetical protein AAGE52_04800 [Myxococcota bacterium]
MNRTTLTKILQSADGVAGSDSVFEASEGHQLSFYVGGFGRGMVINDVQKVHLQEDYIRLDRKASEGAAYLSYELIQGLTVRPNEKTPAGF